ncbi:MAG: hypothetical protein PHU12_00235 [Candidatus Aenigmarchaeota archaeon]|nr:hypothetical protein [Candidatus Aenigmarchaeota archaeon]
MLNIFNKNSDNKIETSPDGHWTRVTYQITQDPILVAYSEELQPKSVTVTYDSNWIYACTIFNY